MRTVFSVTTKSEGGSGRSGAVLANALEGQLRADDRQQIAAIPERYVEHALAADWAAVAQLYHSQAIQVMPDAPPAEGREAIRKVLERQFGSGGGVRLREFSVEIAEAALLGDTVYVRAHYRLVVEPLGAAGAALCQDGPYVNLLRRDTGGRWRIWRQFVGRASPTIGAD